MQNVKKIRKRENQDPRFEHYSLSFLTALVIIDYGCRSHGYRCIKITPRKSWDTRVLTSRLLCSSSNEDAETMIIRVSLQEHNQKIQLRNIARQFRKEKFRIKFAVYVKRLEDLMFNTW